MDLKLPCFVSPFQLANAFEAMDERELRDFVNEMLASVGDESAADIVRAFMPTAKDTFTCKNCGTGPWNKAWGALCPNCTGAD